MEVRLIAGTGSPLALRVLFSEGPGFQVASVIVSGATEPVPIDAQWTSVQRPSADR